MSFGFATTAFVLTVLLLNLFLQWLNCFRICNFDLAEECTATNCTEIHSDVLTLMFR